MFLKTSRLPRVIRVAMALQIYPSYWRAFNFSMGELLPNPFFLALGEEIND
jgi:hypothetical protein